MGTNKNVQDFPISDNPCDAKFWTGRPEIWLEAVMGFYTKQHKEGHRTHPPRLYDLDMVGQTITIPNKGATANSDGEDKHVKINVYKSGVVVIQEPNTKDWENTDYRHIQSMVERLSTDRSRGDPKNRSSPQQKQREKEQSEFFEFEWGFYALSASKAIFRARTYNCNLFSPVMMIT